MKKYINMKSPELIIHGTSSETDAEKITNEGFNTQEGRPTFSGDLIYGFEWATQPERRKGSKSESEIGEEEKGRMIIMKVPEDTFVSYGTHTDIEIDEESKEITGYSSKYESGRKQFAIYEEGDIIEKRKAIEQAKQELTEINTEISHFFEENNLDSKQIKTRGDLLRALESFDIPEKLKILAEAEELETKKREKKKLAEPDISIVQENVLMSIIPTAELGAKLDELSQKIRNLEKVDLASFTEEISQLIEDDTENFLAPGLDIRESIGTLMTSTVETEVINMVRSLSIDIKRAQGYEIYNRGEVKEKKDEVDKAQLKEILEQKLSIVESDNFDIGLENLNRYIRIHIKKLLEELEK